MCGSLSMLWLRMSTSGRSQSTMWPFQQTQPTKSAASKAGQRTQKRRRSSQSPRHGRFPQGEPYLLRKRVEKKRVLTVGYSSHQYFIIHLHQPLEPAAKLTLTLSYHLQSALTPIPAAIEQDGKQYLSYTFPQFVPSAYTTNKQKTTVKFRGTDVPDYTRPTTLKSEEDPKREGSTFTYGPYDMEVKPGTSAPITVRYEYTRPVVTCTRLERDIEISHWGGNMATEDRFWFRNDAAKLTKQFSRVEWTKKQFHNAQSVALNLIRVPLAPGSVNPYFIDDIGNVSTSRFLPATETRLGLLDLRPRYPIFGDWKYSFKIGWNNPLSSVLRKQKTGSGESYVLKVPFIEGPKIPEGVQYQDLEIRIILPEGAENVKYEIVDGLGIPNHIRSEISFYKTFLDTKGRTVLNISTTKVGDEAKDGFIIVCPPHHTPCLRTQTNHGN